MASERDLEKLKQGVDAWNHWRKDEGPTWPDLSGSDLSRQGLYHTEMVQSVLRSLPDGILIRGPGGGADLRQINLSQANLQRVNLSRADLRGADLRAANLLQSSLTRCRLDGADLGGAKLGLANLSHASLVGANLSEADLSYANLNGAELRQADLTDAIADGTVFANVDLSEVKGLDTLTHIGPSSVGIDTLYRSGGRLPRPFLEGVGVPRSGISLAISQSAMQSLDFATCFISYSNADYQFAKRLCTDLIDNGVRCWFGPEALKIGDKFRQRIDDAIRDYDRLLVILSQESVASDWVQSEVETALEIERATNKNVLFPVRIDDEVMSTDRSWAAHLRRMRHIGDFTGWDIASRYQRGLSRLLRDLRANKGQPTGTKE